MPWDSEEPKELTLNEAVEMLNECGTNIDARYEGQVLDQINKAVKRLRHFENILVGVDRFSGGKTKLVITERQKEFVSKPLLMCNCSKTGGGRVHLGNLLNKHYEQL